MKANALRSCLLALFLLGAGGEARVQAQAQAQAQNPGRIATIPIEQIKPGMTGYGLTVFSGFKIERFTVQVIDVIRNFLPKQDLFLIRADHPLLRQTGVVGGMSGSPIYLDGKLAGALAYGWRFAKEPICGVTPIKHMLELLQRKPRGAQSVSWVAAAHVPVESRALAALSPTQRWWKLPFPRPAAPSQAMLSPVAVPLNVAGLSTEAVAELRTAFASYGFEPVQGGGTGRAEGPDRFQAGGSLGVQLVSGDVSMSGTGTVTWIEGNRVLGFGHRMFNAGEIYLPAVTARVNHTLASVQRSFKLASPARRAGSLTQDRQAGILVDMGQTIGTVPLTVTMHAQGQTRVLRARLVRHRLLTPTLASSVFSSALSQALADVDHATFKVASRISIKGHRPVYIEDNLYASSGVVMTAAIFSRGIRTLREVLNNDFAPVQIERVDIDVDVNYAVDAVEIVGVAVSQTTVRPGARINIMVTFRPYSGGDYTKAYPLEIPAALGASVVNVEVASGIQVQPDRAPPENLQQFLQDLQEGYPSRSVVLSLETPHEGLKVRGRLLRDLPASAIDSLSTATQVRGEQTFQQAQRQVFRTQRVIVGRKSIRLRVRSEVNK